MTELPKAGVNYIQERRGIAALQSYAADRGQIWRETGTGDVGIDGLLEFVNTQGFATGRTVAIQVKTGRTYFQNQSPVGWKYYPENKHRNYWEQFPLPVILVLHDSNNRKSYWVDARQALRVPASEERAFIDAPKTNVLELTNPVDLFETAGVVDQTFVPEMVHVLRQLVMTVSNKPAFPLSYFDLFTHGLTNICRSIYYGTDLICNAVTSNLTAQQSTSGISMGPSEQEFAFGFVKFLLAQNLAQIDYSDCLIDWVDRMMQPHFVAPLTSRGRALVELIGREEDRFVSSGTMPVEAGRRVAQEGYFEMVAASYVRRWPRINHFQDVLKKEGGFQ
ncbi:MAG: DUF4365 domain-containing protein [Deltaproteobacteria bacterium]|nr:DUF4365 domain-containing protein [Deltaproteobacteria bacterium]